MFPELFPEEPPCRGPVSHLRRRASARGPIGLFSSTRRGIRPTQEGAGGKVSGPRRRAAALAKHNGHERSVISDGTVAHGLRGASHTIVGFASLLEARATDDRDRRALAAIVTSARRVSAIADALGLLAADGYRTRTEPARYELAVPHDPPMSPLMSPLMSVRDSVDRAIEAHRSALALRAVHLDVTITGDPDIGMDVAAFESLVDLLMHWVVARSQPDRRVLLHAEQPPHGPTRIEIDLGCEASADDAWAIATELAHSCGAELRLDENRGRATLVDAHHRRPQPVETSTAQRLLYVDDDASGRALLELAVESIGGCELLTAGSGAEAAPLLDTEEFDLVIVDHHLGDALGLDLLDSWIPRLSARCRTYLLTGDRDRALVARAEAIGVGVLHKPLDMGHLVQAIVTTRGTAGSLMQR